MSWEVEMKNGVVQKQLCLEREVGTWGGACMAAEHWDGLIRCPIVVLISALCSKGPGRRTQRVIFLTAATWAEQMEAQPEGEAAAAL